MSRSNRQVTSARAILLKRTDFGESDLVLTLFTDTLGKLSALARGARRSHKRFGGALEPFHGLSLRITAPQSGDLFKLEEAQLSQVRASLVGNLHSMTVAGRALTWVRRALPAQSIETELFATTTALLDELDEEPPRTALGGDAKLARFGLALLSHLGFGLELSQCVRCGRPCPPNRPVTIAPDRGGIVCQSCGGARLRVDAATRSNMLDAAEGRSSSLNENQCATVLTIIDQALKSHGILEP